MSDNRERAKSFLRSRFWATDKQVDELATEFDEVAREAKDEAHRLRACYESAERHVSALAETLEEERHHHEREVEQAIRAGAEAMLKKVKREGYRIWPEEDFDAIVAQVKGVTDENTDK